MPPSVGRRLATEEADAAAPVVVGDGLWSGGTVPLEAHVVTPEVSPTRELELDETHENKDSVSTSSSSGVE